eukprot:scaffold66659_cov33-Cyclotella_meneghiniana.AAC.2
MGRCFGIIGNEDNLDVVCCYVQVHGSRLSAVNEFYWWLILASVFEWRMIDSSEMKQPFFYNCRDRWIIVNSGRVG